MSDTLSTGPRAAGESFALGVDVGTSSVKATVLSSEGRTASFTSTSYPTEHPHAGWAEQDPELWWVAVGQVLAAAADHFPGMEAANLHVGLAGQMHTSVLRDEDGAVLRPAVLWSDTRAGVEEERRLLASSARWESSTGHLPMPAFTSAHLSWISRHQPDVLARVARISVPKDDVRQRLGAGWATEPSDASAMNLMDLSTAAWSTEALGALGIDSGQLPPIVPSGSVTGVIRRLPPSSADLSRLLGAPVVGGAGDQAAQALALDVVGGDHLGLSAGTSGVALRASSSRRTGVFAHALPDAWLGLDSTHAAGLALQWWVDLSGMPFDAFEVIGEGGPLFLPYLQGGRGKAGPPGTLTQLRVSHGRREVAAAVVEGVALELVRLARGLGPVPASQDVVGLGGRASQIPALQRLLASGLGVPVRPTLRGPAYGVALLAARSAGWLAATEHPVGHHADVVEPEPALTGLVATRIERARELSRVLDPHPPRPGEVR